MDKKRVEAIAVNIMAECIGLRVRLLNRWLTSIYDDALRPMGVTTNQFNLLIALSRLGKTTAKRISKLMLMDASTVSRTLERMRKEGWVKGTTAEDARSEDLTVTEKGLDLLKKAHPAWCAAQDRARRILGEKNVATIHEVGEVLWTKARTA